MQVIANLEILLAQAVAKAKSVPALQAEVNNLRTKVESYRTAALPVWCCLHMQSSTFLVVQCILLEQPQPHHRVPALIDARMTIGD
jgi:hypothetical protein